MSDPHAAPKKGAVAKIWGAVGVTVAGLLGIVVLFMVLAAIAPMAFSGLMDTLAVFGGGFSQVGVAITSASVGLSVFLVGLFGLLLKLGIYVLLFALAGFGLKMAIDAIRAKAKGGGTPPHP